MATIAVRHKLEKQRALARRRADWKRTLSASRLGRGRVSVVSTTLRLVSGVGEGSCYKRGVSDKRIKIITPPSRVWGEGGGQEREGPALARVRGEGEGRPRKADPCALAFGTREGLACRVSEWRETLSVSCLGRGRGTRRAPELREASPTRVQSKGGLERTSRWSDRRGSEGRVA
jgi:hypothetical protein